ncbi:MAG TPA: YdeI/OmpD-associated family protein [Candidatus Acidoferrum sp.]|nr:YdeI/OmpD-associated family protein [Candidatus Acidoferrum sp.]
MRFRALIEGTGKTAAGMHVPPAVVESFGKGRKPPVRVTINGYTYRTTVAVMGGEYMVGVSNEHRTNAGVAAGQTVDVDIELDTDPRVVTVPTDFQAALDADPEAARFYAGLSYTNRSRFAISIEEAKTAETRERRIAKSVAMLHEGKI